MADVQGFRVKGIDEELCPAPLMHMGLEIIALSLFPVRRRFRTPAHRAVVRLEERFVVH